MVTVEELIESIEAKLDDKFNKLEAKLDELRFDAKSDAVLLKKQFDELSFEIKKLKREIQDVKRDQRTDAGIARAVQAMKFEPIPYELEGSSFIEEIKDYY